MASGAQSFYSTPTFELFRRGLTTQTIKNFRGINVYQSVTVLTAEHALDCMNVLIPGTGGVSKFRMPVKIADIPAGEAPVGPFQIFDFQQANGTRQVVGTFGQSLYYYTWATPTQLSAATLIEAQAGDAQPWSMAEANQMLFAANGQRMMKWTGIKWQNWGIAAPVAAPVLGGNANGGTFAPVMGLTRLAGTVTLEFTNPNSFFFAVGDTVTVLNCPDASFNGSFKVATVPIAGKKYTYANAGADTNAPAGFLVTAPSTLSQFVIINLSRVNGVATATVAGGVPVNPGPVLTIAGCADASFNGSFNVAASDGMSPGHITFNQPGLADSTPGAGGTISFGITVATSRSVAYAYQNSVTQEISNISPVLVIPPGTNRIFNVVGAASPDNQVDTLVWFASLDGGGDLFQDQVIVNGGPVLMDQTPDAFLNQAVQGPLIYGVPPVGKYLTVGQSRVFVANLVGDSTAIAYSGFEQITYPGALPASAFPPGNRLRLQIGADPVAGIGVLQNGVVGFSVTKKMYMLRGQVEDISLAAPVAFSQYLEELPWNMGTMCHQSIQSTPYGLIFWGSDKTVQLFDGHGTLSDLSGPVYPILRRATAGFESVASSAYFNWLERDWYGLSFPIDNSQTNNFTIFWALQKDTQQVDIFPCNIGMACLTTLSTSAMQRILAIGQNGQIMNLPVSQDTTGGISDPALIPRTNAKLAAWWRSGYFGNESPVRSKMARRGLAVTDQEGFSVTVRTVNNRTHKVTNPKLLPKKRIKDGTFSVNDRANRVSVEINFPDDDISCNLLELTVGYIPTSDRF